MFELRRCVCSQCAAHHRADQGKWCAITARRGPCADGSRYQDGPRWHLDARAGVRHSPPLIGERRSSRLCCVEVDICTPMNRPDGRMTDLIAANGCLLVFVDDTGHETFAGDQPYYGLGGGAVMIEAYEPLKARWKSLRRLINGHEDLPLHASTLKPDPTHLGALVEFFRDQSFFRLAVTTTQNMDYPAHLLHSVQPVIEQLKKYVVS